MVTRTYPIGAQVTVYYDPADPAQAVLTPGKLERGSLVWPWVMAAMATLCALGLALTFRLAEPQERRSAR